MRSISSRVLPLLFTAEQKEGIFWLELAAVSSYSPDLVDYSFYLYMTVKVQLRDLFPGCPWNSEPITDRPVHDSKTFQSCFPQWQKLWICSMDSGEDDSKRRQQRQTINYKFRRIFQYTVCPESFEYVPVWRESNIKIRLTQKVCELKGIVKLW
jgi:hypothetical protein